MSNLLEAIIPSMLFGSLPAAVLLRALGYFEQPKLFIKKQIVNYSIGKQDNEFKDLKISYQQKEFTDMMLYEFYVKNISKKTILQSPFLFECSSHVQILEKIVSYYPVDQDYKFKERTNKNSIYEFNFGELKPNDYARLRILITPTTEIKYKWRGDDLVKNYEKIEKPNLIIKILFFVGFFMVFFNIFITYNKLSIEENSIDYYILLAVFIECIIGSIIIPYSYSILHLRSRDHIDVNT